MGLLALFRKLKKYLLPKEDAPAPYAETFTKCDRCEYLPQCVETGAVIDVTSSDNDYQHYIRGIFSECMTEVERSGV